MHGVHRQLPQRPLGAQIHTCSDAFIEQEWQDVVAIHTLVGGRVDLQPIAEIEQALGAVAFPDQ
ncbi:hypothetical protein D3C76_1673920 [compost metagenome]